MTWLVSHLAWIGGFLLAVVLLAHIIRQRRAPTSTIAWILFIVMAPYLGVPFYLLFGGRKVARLAQGKAKIRLPTTPPETDTISSARSLSGLGGLKRGSGRASTNVHDFEAHSGSTQRKIGDIWAALPLPQPIHPKSDRLLERLLSAQGIPPASDGNHITLCETGEQSYSALVALIEGATQRIDLCFFILHPDRVGSDIVQRLSRRAAEGVEVRLLLDGVGSLHTRARFLKPLAAAGGRFAFFNPVLHRPLRGRANLRNHRKLVIADGCRVLAGGANVACEYMGPEARPDRWRDLTFVIEGTAVDVYVELFAADWQYASDETPGDRRPIKETVRPTAGEARLQVLPSGPDMTGDDLYDALLTAIFSARRRLWLITPYFIPDEALCRAVILAARRGVEVRILVPQQSDHRLADSAGRSYLREIQQEGGTVLLYEHGMVHAKAVLVDDELAVLGSANTDMRSLLLNYEVAVLVYSRVEIEIIERWMDGLMKGGREGVGDVGAAGEIGEGLARLLAPQL